MIIWATIILASKIHNNFRVKRMYILWWTKIAQQVPVGVVVMVRCEFICQARRLTYFNLSFMSVWKFKRVLFPVVVTFFDHCILLCCQITYGGRVTDKWDQRCLSTILKTFFAPNTLEEGYKFSPSGVYYAPNMNTIIEYRQYIDQLPLIDEPEIFGLHENANIAFQVHQPLSLVFLVLIKLLSHFIVCYLVNGGCW